MSDPICVSLDLELIGAGDDDAEIIEIGAVKFCGDQVLGRWSTLVRPRRALSLKVRELTGIDEAALRTAPDFPEVAARLRAIVGELPLVGQSIDLDVRALARHGLALRNPLFDTYELAVLLLPGLAVYDLPSVARALGLPSDHAHRALADAEQARQVFVALCRRLRQLDLDTLMHINRLAAMVRWPLAPLFQEAERARTREYLRAAFGAGASQPAPTLPLVPSARPAPPPGQPLVPASRARPLDLQALRADLAPGGRLARHLPGFEARPQQVRMMEAVAEAFNAGRCLVVEAGTGTGKSLAYLLPAVHYAVQNGRRVVISTNTINLQDQLFQKDLPALQRALGLLFRTALLKGRANYLCLHRWRLLLRSESLTADEASLLIKTLVWLAHTTSGDRAELRLTPGEAEAWNRVCALAEYCTPARCPDHREGVCFLARARRAAEEAHIVVVNHSLLLADLVPGARVLPEYQHLIIDEAHHLEDEATEQLSFRAAERDFSSALDELWPTAIPPRGSGGLRTLVGICRRAGLRPEALREVESRAGEAEALVGDLLAELRRWFQSLGRFVATLGERDGQATTVRLTPTARAGKSWDEIELAWERVEERLLALLRAGTALVDRIATLPSLADEAEDLLADLTLALQRLDGLREQVHELVHDPRADRVYWVAAGAGDDASLHAAPLHVGSRLRSALYDAKQTVVLTSATLTTGGSFDYLAERLGLQDFDQLALGSPYNYERSTLLYLPTDVPEPGHSHYQKEVERAVVAAATAAEGRTLVLFTSHSQLRATYEAVRRRLETEGIVVLGQRLDGSRSRLLQAFKQRPRTVLMGTASFWEGIDVVGDALSCLVIVRLPFAVPSEPIFAARSEAFANPFQEYAVPQAILRFKQGFGRLIRSHTDRGIVVILDRRVQSKSYGELFLRSLPPCTVRRGPTADLPHHVRQWLGAAPAAAG